MRKEQGFTLIETVLALSIAAVLLVAVLSALKLGISSWERSGDLLDRSAVKRNIVHRLEREVASAYPLAIKDGNPKIVFSGRNDAVGFVTVASTASSISGARWVYYSLEDEGLRTYENYLTTGKLLSLEGGILVETAAEVREVNFKYLGKDGWGSVWEPEKNELPMALKADLFLRNNDKLSVTIPLGVSSYGQSGKGPS